MATCPMCQKTPFPCSGPVGGRVCVGSWANTHPGCEICPPAREVGPLGVGPCWWWSVKGARAPGEGATGGGVGGVAP